MSFHLESQYIPCLEYFSLLAQTDLLIWDINSTFQKQTYRNRCYVLGSNKIMPLVVPINHPIKMSFKDITIDNSQSWVRDHWGAIYSSYGKSPFFEHFGAEFKDVLLGRYKFLLELNHAMLSVCLRLLGWQIDIQYNEPQNDAIDLRNLILPKISFENRNFYHPIPYQQNFGNTFVPNLSIIDLLMCQGPETGKILKSSISTPIRTI